MHSLGTFLSILVLQMVFQAPLCSIAEEIEEPGSEPFVIFLNGCSSAGKTSIARQLQEQLSEPFLHVGFDHFLFMLPSRYILDGDEAHLGFWFERVDDAEGPKSERTSTQCF